MKVAAFDLDLRKVYCVTSEGQVLAKADPTPFLALDQLSEWEPDLVLVEVVSPILYMEQDAVWKEIKGEVVNRLRWALWNITAAKDIDNILGSNIVRVAPSHVWTKGHALKMRHEVAQCKMKQKDLRECEAMMFYHQHSPESWIPLAKYLETL
jgi:hypothetical protein